ncbi:DUF3806 domain-containing protein [Polaromonas sp.]|uniref:DUF3806 domain-containing protein n=1 Tax=Polaromonas sp. TaxID=1869339 RepID=UPI003266A605
MKIEPPNKKDVRWIAERLVHADDLVYSALGKHLEGQLSDLALLQQVIDRNLVEREATYSLQALGLAFGKVFVNANENYDWWMVEDEYGRDPAIRYGETSIRVFPQTMISKRVEDQIEVNVRALYDGLLEQLDQIRREIDEDA